MRHIRTTEAGMSFYTVIRTQLNSKKYILCALEELKKKGKISIGV